MDSTSFKLSPAARTSLIIGGLLFSLIAISVYAVYRKADEVTQQKRATKQANAAVSVGEMIWIPGGSFTMGGIGDNIPNDELPLHDVNVDGFWMDKTEVTNEQFTQFTAPTGYITVAERPLSAKNTPGLLPEFEGKTVSLCLRK